MIPRCKIYRVTRRRKASTGSESLALRERERERERERKRERQHTKKAGFCIEHNAESKPRLGPQLISRSAFIQRSLYYLFSYAADKQNRYAELPTPEVSFRSVNFYVARAAEVGSRKAASSWNRI